MLYCNCGVGSRGVGKVVDVVNLVFGGIAGEAPSHDTVLGWVEKFGYALSRESKRPEHDGHALIIDNSVNMNGQELHLELEAPAAHPGHALTHGDVRVVCMKVGRKWDTAAVKGELAQSTAGRRPAYVVSDNARPLCRACRELGLAHHRDISHSFGMFLERVYSKTEELAEFNRGMAYARKFSHTEIGCLMPPRRRDYARFMNLFDRIDWAYLMLHNFHKLPDRGKAVFGFLLRMGGFVDEMKEVMDWYRRLERLCKEHGLSFGTSRQCVALVNSTFMQRGERLRTLGRMLIDYFRQEESLLESSDAVHNICSDVIESTFGYVKGRLPSNKNNGFTPLVLLIPAHLRVADIKSCKDLDLSDAMRRTKLADIARWRKENLLPNPTKTRARTLSMAM